MEKCAVTFNFVKVSCVYVTGSYLPQLNANDSKQKIEEHRYKHDIPDRFHGYKDTLHNML